MKANIYDIKEQGYLYFFPLSEQRHSLYGRFIFHHMMWLVARVSDSLHWDGVDYTACHAYIPNRTDEEDEEDGIYMVFDGFFNGIMHPTMMATCQFPEACMYHYIKILEMFPFWDNNAILSLYGISSYEQDYRAVKKKELSSLEKELDRLEGVLKSLKEKE